MYICLHLRDTLEVSEANQHQVQMLLSQNKWLLYMPKSGLGIYSGCCQSYTVCKSKACIACRQVLNRSVVTLLMLYSPLQLSNHEEDNTAQNLE